MELEAYLKRIEYRGVLEPTFSVLCKLHKQHLLTIPYENLDIHLGRYMPLDPEHSFTKLVTQKRGGWCYEMNSLFAWALREIGFKVNFIEGAVLRSERGDKARRNHLVLRVELDKPYLADVGFGDGFLEPIPLVEGTYQQEKRTFELKELSGYWRFFNDTKGSAATYDFWLEPVSLEYFAHTCHDLQTSPESGFVQVTVCQGFTETSIVSLKGAVLKELTSEGLREVTISSGERYRDMLREYFGLELDVTKLWSKVWASHLAWRELS